MFILSARNTPETASNQAEQVNKVAFYHIETKSVCKCVWDKTSAGLPHMLHYLNNPCWALVKNSRNMQCLAVRLSFSMLIYTFRECAYLFWQLEANRNIELILQILMQQQSIICRKWEVSVITGQYRNMSTQCLCWHDVLNWYIVTALEEKKIIKFDEYNGTMILKVREKKVVRKWNSHVRADKISWKLMFLLEMMVTSSRMAWKVSMLINQGSCELKDQEMKLMRKISMSNTKAVFNSSKQ